MRMISSSIYYLFRRFMCVFPAIPLIAWGLRAIFTNRALLSAQMIEQFIFACFGLPILAGIGWLAEELVGLLGGPRLKIVKLDESHLLVSDCWRTRKVLLSEIDSVREIDPNSRMHRVQVLFRRQTDAGLMIEFMPEIRDLGEPAPLVAELEELARTARANSPVTSPLP